MNFQSNRTLFFSLIFAISLAGCASDSEQRVFDEQEGKQILKESGADSIIVSGDNSPTLAEDTSLSDIPDVEEKTRIESLITESEVKATECCQEWEPGLRIETCCCDSLIIRYAYALKTDIDRALKIMETDPYYTACKKGYKKYQAAIDRLESQ